MKAVLTRPASVGPGAALPQHLPRQHAGEPRRVLPRRQLALARRAQHAQRGGGVRGHQPFVAQVLRQVRRGVGAPRSAERAARPSPAPRRSCRRARAARSSRRDRRARATERLQRRGPHRGIGMVRPRQQIVGRAGRAGEADQLGDCRQVVGVERGRARRARARRPAPARGSTRRRGPAGAARRRATPAAAPARSPDRRDARALRRRRRAPPRARRRGTPSSGRSAPSARTRPSARAASACRHQACAPRSFFQRSISPSRVAGGPGRVDRRSRGHPQRRDQQRADLRQVPRRRRRQPRDGRLSSAGPGAASTASTSG